MARKGRPLRLAVSTLVLWLAVVALLAGCQRASRQEAVDQAPDVQVALSAQPNPPSVGSGRITVTLGDAAGKAVPDAKVHLRGDMAHAGMRPVEADAMADGTGAYQADFDWSMAGDWIVTVTATLPDGRTATRQFDVTVSAQ